MYPSRWKLASYAIVILLGCLLAVPNLFSKDQLARLPDWLPKQQVALGLDLRGGAHLVLEIDGAAVRRDRVDSIADGARAALREAGLPAAVAPSADGVTVRYADPARRVAIEAALRGLVSTVVPPGLSSPQPDMTVTTGAGQEVTLRPTDAAIAARLHGAIEQSLEIVRRRIDEVGVAEPTIQRLGADRILVQLPGVQDPDRIKTLLGSTAKMAFHMVADAPGPGTEMVPDANGTTRYPLERRALLQGDRLTDASPGFDQRTGQPVVNFKLDAVGARRFGEITAANVGRPFAIVLDGKVLSAPVIREPITGGSGQISGHFTTADAASLSALLRAGALPIPLKVIEERTVGPDLGADSIRMGALTGLVGFALVCGFMLMLYGRWGLVANLALTLNIALTFACLSLLGATLTLPGIAGIVLGIGLAVDANVLINERIREETRKGISAAAALDAGFRRAYSTIVDSNVTTLIATLLLFWFGSGPVRGFAVTMGLGIAISMFTAVTVVRAIMATWVRKARPKQFVIRPLFRLNALPTEPKIKFMKARFFGIGLSIFLSLASVALFMKPGLDYGIDFVGGIVVEVRTPEAADLPALRGAVDTLGLGEASLQEFGDDHTVMVRVERQPGGEEAQLAAVNAVKAAVAEVSPRASFERVEVVGPKVSGELAYAGVLAVVLASLAMLAYIWFRFEWQFAVGAIATLALDVTKTVGFFALTGLDFNLTAIAALLTLIGYSVNDKVVVYDRMRENLRRFKAMPLRELIDLSINQTIARSLYTSATAFLAMLPIALFGGPAVESFAQPMLFGIFIAASSSIFIAAPILLFLGAGSLRRERALPLEEAAPVTPG
ncbi:MAG: protein translocase subunit SecD [Rhodospirillales bacterium]